MSAQITRTAARHAPTTHPVAWPELGLLRGTWYRIRLAVEEMNYASRRVAELQAPWIVDKQWHTK